MLCIFLSGISYAANTSKARIGAFGVNVKSFGAQGDGVTNDTIAIQSAINYASTNGLNVYVPSGHYLFTRLYFYHDPSLNPDWPSTAGKEGRLIFIGDGAAGGYDVTYRTFKRTVLESIDQSGPAFDIYGDNVVHRLNRLKFRDITVKASNSSQVIKFKLFKVKK